MNYDLGDEQKMLRESARKFFAKEVDSTLVRRLESDPLGYSPEIWEKMGKLGWMGLLVPEAYGGLGLDFFDMAIILMEMGRAAFPSPFFTSSVLSTLVLLETGTEEQKRRLLPEVSDGREILTTAWQGRNMAMAPVGISAVAVCQEEEYVLTGTTWMVPWAHVAHHLIVAARTAESDDTARDGDGISLFLVDRKLPGLSVEILDTSSGERQGLVRLDQVRVPASSLMGQQNRGWKKLERILLKCAVAKCAEIVGGAERVLEMTVDYAQKREQFGRPIGSFQAIQHHCANMKIYLDTSALITYQACWRISKKELWEKEAAMCKAWVSDSLRELGMLGHQVMGGFGFMEETDLQLYTRRFRYGEMLFGDAAHSRELVAQRMGL